MPAMHAMDNYAFYADANLVRYAGDWVAIVEGKVVSHGKNLKGVLKNAKQIHPSVTPFVAKIPVKDILLG